MKKKRLFYIAIFILFFIIFTLSPISGDDWGNYLEGAKGFRHIVGQTIGMYFDWEGRIVSRFLINIFTYNKILWNIVNSLLIVFLIFIILKIIKPKNTKLIYLLTFLIIFSMNIYTFSQTMVWIAGNVTYFVEIPLILLYLYILIEDKYKDKTYFIINLLLSIIIPMFVEHMAIITILINIIFIGYKYYKEKKVDKKLIINLIISIISTLTMFLSPGNMTRRNMENVYFNELSLFGKISYNIPNFIYYTIIINTYAIILLSISNYFIIKDKIKNNLFKIFMYIYMLFIPLISIFTYIISNFINISFLNIFINTNNIFIEIFYIIYLFIILYLLILNRNLKTILFYILSISSNAIMLMSPTWGFRTSLFTYILLVITSLLVIDKYYKNNNLLEKIISLLALFISIIYLILYINVYRCNNDIKKIITKQLKENKNVIEVFEFPNYVNCNINPTNDYHLARFKEYYNISTDKEVKLVPGKWKWLIFYKK